MELPRFGQRLEEREGLQARGMAVLLRNRETGKYYVGQEKQDKPNIRRKAGTLTIITETAKVDESLMENLRGALGEYPLTPDDEIWVSEFSYLGVVAFAGSGECHVVILDMYTQTTDMQSLKALSSNFSDKSEVQPVGWMTIEEIVESENLRYGTRELLEWVMQQEKLQKYLERNLDDDERFSDYEEIKNWVEEREGMPDERGEYFSSADMNR